MDTTGTGIRYPQKFHLPEGAAYRRGDPQGGENTTEMGLGYRETEAKGSQESRSIKDTEIWLWV